MRIARKQVKCYRSAGIMFLILCMGLSSLAQKPTIITDSSDRNNIIVIAGDYKANAIHKALLGKNYRKEWGTPVKIKVLMLDTTFGGIIAYKGGGGRQSRSLHMHDKQGREYVMRSIDKSFGRAIPPIYQGTFIEDLVNDQVTIGDPYAALTIPPMAEAAKIYHTNPTVVYVAKQPGLDSFNDKYGNFLYLLEQRPSGNWEMATNFGRPKKITSTYKMLKKLLKDNDNRVDQQLYVRSRLFDMFIGDWGRHEDQWRWGAIKQDGKTTYQPIPRDRDQAYTVFKGFFTKVAMGVSGLGHMQSFDNDIKDIKGYNFTARHLDRACANELSLQQWLDIASDLQQNLTDEVIENAVKQMPPEVYPMSGPEIVAKLKSRRSHLQEYAAKYYKFLARHVDVTGSEGTEYFEVKRLNDKETQVNIYNIRKDGSTEATPYYSRLFKRSETKDVRLYGIGGNDKFTIDGKVNKGIKIRMIGGRDKDTMIDNSAVADGRRKTEMDDDDDNTMITSAETKQHLSEDSANYAYNYKDFEYHKKGIKGIFYYANPDKFFISLGYGFSRHIWRKYPYGWTQQLQLRYSLTENSWSVLYDASFYQLIGKWNLNLSGSYDLLRTTNYYGLGNEAPDYAKSRAYNRMKMQEYGGTVGLARIFHKYHHVNLTASVKAVLLINEPGAYVTDTYKPVQASLFEFQKFAVANAGYTYQNVDDQAVPTKGAMFYTGASYTHNIEKPKGFATYYSILQLYVPVIGKFSISSRTGIKAVSGDPEFYQYASIGGSQTMRGYARDRFWGNTAFYNTNELRYITNFRTYIMNGKIGLCGIFDDGRVWLKGEQSDKWHYGYGGGLILAPFNKAMFTFSYVTSEDGLHFQVRLTKMFYKISTQESKVRL